MAVPIADLAVRFRGDTGHYDRARNRVEAGNQSIRRSFSAVQKAAAAAFVVAGVGLAAKRLFDLGAAVEETASKYRTVFGPAVNETNAFIRSQARLLGLTTEEAQGIVATTGAIAQGMGLSQRASASFSTEVVGLAGDLASFNNVPIEQTSRAIQSALTGEREALKRLGIVVRETEVQQIALANSGKATVDALTQQERATATLQLITERAGVAVGDLARTQDSAANRARRVAAQWRQMRDDLATLLMPALEAGLGLLATFTERLITFPMRLRLAFGRALETIGLFLFNQVTKWPDWLRNLLGIGEHVMDLSIRLTAFGSANVTEATEALRAFNVERRGATGVGDGEAAMDLAEPIIAMADSMGLVTIATEHATRAVRVARDEVGHLAQVGAQLARTFSDTLVDAVRGGKDAFKNFVDFAITQLLRLAAQLAIISGLKALAGGGGGLAGAAGSILTAMGVGGGASSVGLATAGGSGASMAPTIVNVNASNMGGSMDAFARDPSNQTGIMKILRELEHAGAISLRVS